MALFRIHHRVGWQVVSVSLENLAVTPERSPKEGIR